MNHPRTRSCRWSVFATQIVRCTSCVIRVRRCGCCVSSSHGVDPSTSTPLPNLLQRRGLASGYSSPESTLTRVDFLALFSPSKACASPAHTAQSTQSCTTRAPPRLTRPCVSRSGDCLPDGALGAGGPFRSPRIARPRVLWWRNSGIGPHTLDRLQDLLGRRRRVERRVNAVIRHARHGIANREEYRE
jgi:hypothetical protein